MFRQTERVVKVDGDEVAIEIKGEMKLTEFNYFGEWPPEPGQKLEPFIPSREQLSQWSDPWTEFDKPNGTIVVRAPVLSACPRITQPTKQEKTDKKAKQDFLRECQQKKRHHKQFK
jgi:hypothetical protein